MKILLVHPDDAPERGGWAHQTWDRVFDLGEAGPDAYERWSAWFGCPAAPVGTIRLEEFRTVRALLATGLGRLVDREGLDWWELTAILPHQQLETLAALRKLANRLGSGDQLFVTRSGFHADALRLLVSNRLECFSGRTGGRRGLQHYRRVWSKFPVPQILEILGDKYDATYAFRRRFALKKKPSRRPVVLLPSAYVNVSRTGIAYANTLPETDFLLVTTRRSGRVANPPANVAVAELASYALQQPETKAEYAVLGEEWRRLRGDLSSVPEFDLLGRLGFLDSFPRLISQGLGIRDAWRAVFEREPVKAVLCADDSNPYTHIPLLLARRRGIPTVACHHGALDGRHLFKQNHADVVLAKGSMEEDYLVRVCGLSRGVVEVGAPAREPANPIVRRLPNADAARQIVFFSEAYEIAGGRGEEFYRDLLPPLASLAERTGRRLVIKLHPAESRRERERLVKKILPPGQQRVTKMVSGPLTGDLLCSAWFGITILSTVAMECALLGIPCFLCGWLEYGAYGYVEQFSRFGAGQVLNSAAEICGIPRLLARSAAGPDVVRDLWQPITQERFQELLSGQRSLEQALAM